jgi:hypothetical protein
MKIVVVFSLARPQPTKITHIFVGYEADENIFRISVGLPTNIFPDPRDEADENTFLIFVGRPTKISGPTKFYVFPVVRSRPEKKRSTSTRKDITVKVNLEMNQDLNILDEVFSLP